MLALIVHGIILILKYALLVISAGQDIPIDCHSRNKTTVMIVDGIIVVCETEMFIAMVYSAVDIVK